MLSYMSKIPTFSANGENFTKLFGFSGLIINELRIAFLYLNERHMLMD